MLEITLLRRDLPQVIARLETRKSPQVFLNVETFQALENERKTLQTRTEELQAKRNSLSKTIGQLKAKGESTDALMGEVAQLKDELDASAVRLDALQAELQTLLLAVPNLPQEGAMNYPYATWIGLNVPREVLDERIKVRAMKMFDDGLIEEVRDLVIDGLMSGTTARLGHGYAQIIEWQMGLNADPIEETIVVTRQYARRQETWFKREKRINWIEAPYLPKALNLLQMRSA